MDAAARERGAVVDLGWELVNFEDADWGVTVEVRERGAESATTRMVTARYLVGADGANSAVRQITEPEIEDFGFNDSFLSVDCERIGELPDELLTGNAIAICDPARHIGFIPIGNKKMRFEFGINPDDDVEEMLKPEAGYDFLANTLWGISDEQVEIYRQVVYKFGGKMTKPWRRQHALLAGDAAHLMPPFMGQGACSGLRDAANLAWKLHMVLSGRSSDELLDTYELERSPHVRVHVAGSIALGEVSCERDPVKAAARNEAYRSGKIPPPDFEPTLTDGVIYRLANGDVAPHAGGAH